MIDIIANIFWFFNRIIPFVWENLDDILLCEKKADFLIFFHIIRALFYAIGYFFNNGVPFNYILKKNILKCKINLKFFGLTIDFMLHLVYTIFWNI